MEAMSNKPKQPLAGPRLLFDIESNGLLEKMTKIHCIVAIDLDTLEVHRFTAMDNTIAKGLELLSSASLLVGHNIICFDLKAIQKLYPEWKPKQGCVIRDTLVYSRLAYGNLKELDFSFLERGLLSKDTFVIWDKAKQQPKSAVGSHSLEAWGIRLKCAKDDFGHTTDWQEFTSEMLEYCVQDCQTNLVLWNKLETKEVPEDALELEMAVAEILHRQELRGWAFDLEKAHVLYGKLCQRREELAQELAGIFPGWYLTMKKPEYYQVEISHKTMADASPWVIRDASKANLEDIVYKQFKGREYYSFTRSQVKAMITEGPLKKKHIAFNPSSRQHICKALKERYNWIPKEFTDSGEAKVDESILSKLKYPEAKVLSEYFVILKRIGQIAEGDQNWIAAVRNGRIHGRCNSLGAVTGRGTHMHPNMAQVPGVQSPYGRECRELFTVAPGYRLVGSDASGQELRCLAHYMMTTALTQELIDEVHRFITAVCSGNSKDGTDVHTMNQKAAGLPTRDDAKTFIYAFLYGAGDGKIGSIVAPLASEAQQRKIGKQLKDTFLRSMPALAALRDFIVAQAERLGYIVALDGRRIPIRSSHAALNSLLQSAGAILTKRWLVTIDEELKARGLSDKAHQVGWIHDELQFEVLSEYAEEVATICREAMVKTQEYYKFNCPLAAGTAIGENWRDTH